MNKNITRIVITGGPCAGKTTALVKIIERFTDMGYLVYALPETPTLFNAASVNFATPDKQYFYNIEKAVLKFQIQMEDTFAELAHTAKQPVLLISDRGTMDISAYMDPTAWQAMIDELGYSEMTLRNARYDAVIHLVTAANGAEQYYTTENNDLRRETVEEARELDSRLISVWTGHHNLRIVENNLDFDDKIHQTIDAISSILGEPSTLGVRRKYLVRLNGSIPYGVEAEIYQAYIPAEDGSTVRIRKRGYPGNYVYFYSQQLQTQPGEILPIVTERQMSPNEYISMLNSIDRSELMIVHKKRKSFVWDRQYFELDTFIEPEQRFLLLEIKGRREEDIHLPPFVELLEDVTDNPDYSRL
ncbi:MAG: ATP-binding protein [Porphyromonas sp.]|nr:ATP-binding protein [Porphyromonas sp.]